MTKRFFFCTVPGERGNDGMSKYRVLDDNKNKYDGEVLTSIVTPETAKGFNISYSNTDDDLENYNQIGIFTLDTFSLNPSGGVYENSNITGKISGKYLSQWYIRDDSTKTGNLTLRFYNATNFIIRITNITLDYELSYATFEEFNTESLNNVDFILNPNETSNDFTVSLTAEEYSAYVSNSYITFTSMNVYRVID